MKNFIRQQTGLKYCSKCNIEQDVNNFYSDKKNCNGLRAECKDCDKKDRDNRRSIDIIGRLLSSAKSSARARNIFFDLKREDIIIPNECPILGIPLYFDNKRGDNTPSIDRIDSNLPYINDNIIICSWRANKIKGSATINEMEMIYNHWFKRCENNELILPNHSFYLKRMIIHCKERCNNKNIIFSLTESDIKIPLYCSVLNIEIKPGKKIFCDSSPSLDRIDINDGYLPQNIRVISWKANKLKQNATYAEYEKIYYFYNRIINEQMS